MAIATDATTTAVSTGKYEYPLTTADNSVQGMYKAVWTYDVQSVTNYKTDHYEVVVGYTSAQEVRDEFPDLSSKSNLEIYRKEKLARRTINVYCNQSFDFEADVTKVVWGQNENKLFLPRRLFELNSVKIDGLDDVTSEVEPYQDYWLSAYSEANPGFFRDVKRGILEPSRFFIDNTKYYVDGNWGWQFVPENIHLACMMLINEYFCDDTILRDHGVMWSTFGDREIRFQRSDKDGSLYLGTVGNYTIDMLLSEYTYVDMRLI